MGGRLNGERGGSGDATDPGFLKACGLMAASGVIVTISQKSVIDEVVERLYALAPAN